MITLERTATEGVLPTPVALEVKTYPFRAGESDFIVRLEVVRQLRNLAQLLPLSTHRQGEFLKSTLAHFNHVDKLFEPEERARKFGVTNANLTYHNKDHALYQTTFDAISITQTLLRRRDGLSARITPESAAAIVLGAIYHDSGYVYQVDLQQNHAARTPIHVDESIRCLDDSTKQLRLPRFLNQDKVRLLAQIGIHATNFPFTPEHKGQIRTLLDGMYPSLRKEAHIVRLATQFADLGGQVARGDYFPRLVVELRREMNAGKTGSGTSIIGEDHELVRKCRGFIEFVVKPMLRKSGIAFFKSPDHAFAKRWDHH